MRQVTSVFRAGIEAPASADVLLLFLTISHPSLSDDIRIVVDRKDFMLGGKKYLAAPVEIDILTDDDRPPRGRITLQNVDRQIGEAVRRMTNSPQLRIQLLSSIDFDLTADPRTPIGTPAVEYEADYLRLRNVSVDPMQITAEIMSFDYSQEPWPEIRATKSRLPGLFR